MEPLRPKRRTARCICQIDASNSTQTQLKQVELGESLSSSEAARSNKAALLTRDCSPHSLNAGMMIYLAKDIQNNVSTRVWPFGKQMAPDYEKTVNQGHLFLPTKKDTSGHEATTDSPGLQRRASEDSLCRASAR